MIDEDFDELFQEIIVKASAKVLMPDDEKDGDEYFGKRLVRSRNPRYNTKTPKKAINEGDNRYGRKNK